MDHSKISKIRLPIILALISLYLFSTPAAQDPGEAIQDALDIINSDIFSLKVNQQATNTKLNTLETRLNASIRDNLINLEWLDGRLRTVEGKVGTIETAITSIRGRLDDLEEAHDRLAKRVSATEKIVGGVVTEVKRLDGANKIWKNNFRIVNNTFTALRKKVTFKVVNSLQTS